jgi:hypothetical protein
MARKGKISEDRSAKYYQQQKGPKPNSRYKRKFYLIVCEGEKTEPNYFEGLKRDLPPGVLTTVQIQIEGTGRNTLSLIDEALRLKKEYEKRTTRPVDKLWTVFDRDSFSPNDFNSAILQCENSKPKIGCAWSNEAFELWYLLHFNYYCNGIQRDGYKRLIERNLKPKVGEGYRYKKNSEEMYNILKEHGSLTDAIRNAKRLAEVYAGREDFADHNPRTMVYKLVEELFNLKDKK